MSTVSASSGFDRPLVVVGSLNMDLVLRTPRVPAAGETLSAFGFATHPGGKGANQAVACARMGAPTRMIGRVGSDFYGHALREALAADGIDAAEVEASAATHSGIAMILVEPDGQNRILLAPGANGELGAADIERRAALIAGAAMLIVQLEVPLAAVERAVAIAHRAGVAVLLNPAPAAVLPETLWPQIDLLVPNESEAAALAGCPVEDAASAANAAVALRARGVGRVVVTLGTHGVVIADADGTRHLPAEIVAAIDTTAAGDCFIGALATALREGWSLARAAAFGQSAAAICVTRAGAQPAIPYRREVREPQ
jgi:ribokinase